MMARQWYAGPAAVVLGTVVLVSIPARGAEAVRATAAAVEERLKRDFTYLASDECEGRGPTTKGIDRAADHIAAQFKKIGLKPGNPDGSYFQPFKIEGALLEGTPRLVLQGPNGRRIELQPGRHFHLHGLSTSADLKDVPVVFAGYGIKETNPAYNDYADLDVAGKVVVVLRDTPRCANKGRDEAAFATGFRRGMIGSFSRKMATAGAAKAVGILYVNDRDTAKPDDLVDFNFTAAGNRGPALPAAHLRRAILESMLKSSTGKDLADLEADVDRELKPRSTPLEGWTVTLEAKVQRGKVLPVKNVVGVLDGKGPLANETVVIGAHYDHLGYGGTGGSTGGSKRMVIHNGADDNASGTSSIIELARRFAAIPDRVGRRIVFIAFSGEELGLYGSIHYCKEPFFPLKDTVAMINLDMVGRLRPDEKTRQDRLLVQGSGTAKTFEALLDRLNEKYQFTMKRQKEGYGPSDHDSFSEKDVPALFFWTADHDEYHNPKDKADTLNVKGMMKIIDFAEEVATEVVTVSKRPELVKFERTRRPRPTEGPTLGLRPEYGGDGTGLEVLAVTPGDAADRGGIRKGDKIVEIAGKPIKEINSYIEVMRTQMKGSTIEVVIVREDKRMTFKIKLD